MSKKGKVYLVGAGPGDPGLLTVRGLQLLREADVLVTDALVPDELFDEVAVACEIIDAGKRSGRHVLEQKQIIRLLIRKAKQGKVVVRLKGGDPFIFGRGGEEGQALKKARISFEVVPGVSSVMAVPAYAGIPLTHRDINSTVTLLTGHSGRQNSEAGPAPLDWQALAQQEVLVMLMGVLGIQRNMQALMEYGKDPRTPVAVIQWGTRPEQRTLVGTVKDIAKQVRDKKIRPPAVIVVGDVVNERKGMNWFETRPLFGKHILVTRSRHQAGELSSRLRAEAARVSEVPTIEIEDPKSFAPLDKAIRNLGNYSWIIFTSANGVDAFFARMKKLRRDARALATARIATIGPATAGRLNYYGLEADIVAKTYQAEGLLTRLPRNLSHHSVLIARAAQARMVLPIELKKRGAQVNVVSCYRSIIPKGTRAELKYLMTEETPDLLTFASSSMVDNFAHILSKNAKLWRRVRKIPTACIGPITAESARSHGMNVVVMPKKYTIPDLVTSIHSYYKRHR